MEKIKTSKLSSILKAEFIEEDTIWLTNGKTLRKTIGILGMALPFLLILTLYFFSRFVGPLESISHYYYTRVSGVFVGIMSILAIFLIIYKGKEPMDLLISLIAGVFALFVVMFPTGNISEICHDATKTYSVTILSKNAVRETFHYLSAAVFLSCLSIMSIFIFTKSDKPKEERGVRKKIRNRIYRVCGGIMVIAMVIILSRFVSEKLHISSSWISFYETHQLTFWMEALAIESFGFSWLIKGETLFKD